MYSIKTGCILLPRKSARIIQRQNRYSTTRVLNKATEMKQKLFEAEHRDWFEAKPKVAMEQPITEKVAEVVIDEVIATEPIADEPNIEKVDTEMAETIDQSFWRK